MNQKRITNITIIILFLVVIIGVGTYFALSQLNTPSYPTACTADAMECPDGSYVGRSGPNCKFECPDSNPVGVRDCKRDSDCSSSQYVCEEIQGIGTACPDNDPSCVPTHTIIQGECKLKEGGNCRGEYQCAGGNLCHKNTCVSPIGRECSGPSDTSCPTDFECRQGCGSPVGYENEPPPPYFCELKGYVRTCPICLAENTLIDTPSGAIPVEELKRGMPVWTVSKLGERVSGIILETSKTPVSSTHKIIHIILEDGREIFASPGHRTIDNRELGDLALGDILDGSPVTTLEIISYKGGYTYDILPSGETGFYFADDILLGSTLH